MGREKKLSPLAWEKLKTKKAKLEPTTPSNHMSSGKVLSGSTLLIIMHPEGNTVSET